MKNFEDLTIADDYMFYHVMQNEDLCKTLLNSILADHIGEIKDITVQKSFETVTRAKGIRLDVWVTDATDKQYNIEMQATKNRDLARRMRYYQSAIDSHLLEKGGHYSELTDAFIIFICPFDYPGKGLPVYTFKSLCLEDGRTLLDDGTTKIMVNSLAAEKAENSNLKAFLEYMNGKASKNEFIQSLENTITTYKHNEKIREEYMYRMTVEDEIRYETRKETLAEAEIEINKAKAETRKEILKEAEAKVESTAQALKGMGVSVEKISKATGIPVSTIESW